MPGSGNLGLGWIYLIEGVWVDCAKIIKSKANHRFGWLRCGKANFSSWKPPNRRNGLQNHMGDFSWQTLAMRNQSAGILAIKVLPFAPLFTMKDINQLQNHVHTLGLKQIRSLCMYHQSWNKEEFVEKHHELGRKSSLLPRRAIFKPGDVYHADGLNAWTGKNIFCLRLSNTLHPNGRFPKEEESSVCKFEIWLWSTKRQSKKPMPTSWRHFAWKAGATHRLSKNKRDR